MKKPTIIFCISTGLSFLLTNPLIAQVPNDIQSLLSHQTKQSHQQTPEALIQKIYQVHQPWANKIIDLNRKSDVVKYFDDDMTRLIMSDNECKKKFGGECNLDFDPFLEAQDYDEKMGYANLKVQRIKSKPEVVIQVSFNNLVPRKIIYHTRMTKTGWRISNIVYQNGQYSLKSILSEPIQ